MKVRYVSEEQLRPIMHRLSLVMAQTNTTIVYNYNTVDEEFEITITSNVGLNDDENLANQMITNLLDYGDIHDQTLRTFDIEGHFDTKTIAFDPTDDTSPYNAEENIGYKQTMAMPLRLGSDLGHSDLGERGEFDNLNLRNVSMMSSLSTTHSGSEPPAGRLGSDLGHSVVDERGLGQSIDLEEPNPPPIGQNFVTNVADPPARRWGSELSDVENAQRVADGVEADGVEAGGVEADGVEAGGGEADGVVGQRIYDEMQEVVNNIPTIDEIDVFTRDESLLWLTILMVSKFGITYGIRNPNSADICESFRKLEVKIRERLQVLDSIN